MTTATEPYRYCRLRVGAGFGVDVPAVALGRAVYFPMRALCGVVGLAPQKQVERLREDGRFADALRTLPVPTPKGLRDAVCINRGTPQKPYVAMWLGSVDTTRCAITAKGPVERFQAELFAAADRFLFGDLSDVVSDDVSRAARPIAGILHLGDCPRCGLGLCLIMDGTGNHLVPEGEE